MDDLSRLEHAVLIAIAAQESGSAAILSHQISIARVTSRQNTGAGFYTTFEVDSDQRLDAARSPVGDVGATVEGLKHGMGFLLWIKEGLIDQLEAYSYDEETSHIDFAQAGFGDVGPRR